MNDKTSHKNGREGFLRRLRKGIITVMGSVEVGPGTRVPPFFVLDIGAACDEVDRLTADLEDAIAAKERAEAAIHDARDGAWVAREYADVYRQGCDDIARQRDDLRYKLARALGELRGYMIGQHPYAPHPYAPHIWSCKCAGGFWRDGDAEVHKSDCILASTETGPGQ